MKRLFISYSHVQANWVREFLCPVLIAGGTEVLLDTQRFEAGFALNDQIDKLQDKADLTVAVLSNDYVRSRYCKRELRRAVERDPTFELGRVVPVLKESCKLPTRLADREVLTIDLRQDNNSSSWQQLLRACGAHVGCCPSEWLRARDELVMQLAQGQSVNLVARGNLKWRPLIQDVQRILRESHGGARLGIVDLDSGAAASRRGFLEEMLRKSDVIADLPPGGAKDSFNEDLVEFARAMMRKEARVLLALQHFDRVVAPDRDYSTSLFAALRDLISCERKLCLLVHSRVPFLELLPKDHALSSLTQVRNVELQGS